MDILRTFVTNIWQSCREWWWWMKRREIYMGEAWRKEFYETRQDLEDERDR